MSRLADAADRVTDPILDALDRARRLVTYATIAAGGATIVAIGAVTAGDPDRTPTGGFGVAATVLGCAIPPALLMLCRGRITAARSVVDDVRAQLRVWTTSDGRAERLDQIREPVDEVRSATTTWGRLRAATNVVFAIRDATDGVISVSTYRDATIGLGVGGGLLLLGGLAGTAIVVGVAAVAVLIRIGSGLV